VNNPRNNSDLFRPKLDPHADASLIPGLNPEDYPLGPEFLPEKKTRRKVGFEEIFMREGQEAQHA